MTPNQRRAMRIGHVLTWCRDWDSGPEGLIDLLTDARHWCDQNGHAFARLDRLAREHYLAEQDAGADPSGADVDEPCLDVHSALAAARKIAVIWSPEDVLEVRPDLTPDQAWDVLQACRRGHAACVGISWDVLATTAYILFETNQSETNQGEANE